MKRLGTALSMLLLFIFITCDRDEVFEREQYKNVFALISESDNVARKFHKLGEESIGYVAASMGGTNPTTKDITVNLVEDQSLLDDFNRINYDTDVSKYGKPMPESKYDIDSYQFTIPAGGISGRLPIRIRPDGMTGGEVVQRLGIGKKYLSITDNGESLVHSSGIGATP
jgi:hypothetical protein